MREEVNINTAYITLGQFIKVINILESGGMVKHFLQQEGVIVNGEHENRRGRKLYPEDIVEIDRIGSYIVTKED